MRRVNPSLFRQRQVLTRATTLLVKPNTAHSSVSLRCLSSTSISLYPRSAPRNRYSNAIAEQGDEPEEWEDDSSPEFVEIDSDPTLPYSSTPPDLPPSKSFESMTCALYPPPSQPDTSPIPEYLKPLHGNLLTTFLPANQPLLTQATPQYPGIAKMNKKPIAIGGPMGLQMMPIDLEDLEGDHDAHDGEGSGEGSKEAVLALVSPFEGGGHYVLDAVRQVAGRIDAEVLTLDLTLGLGFDGVAAPLAGIGTTAPELPSSLNPLLQSPVKPTSPPPSPFGNSMMEDDGNEDGEEEPDNAPRAAAFLMPLPGRMVGLHNHNPGPFGNQALKGGVRDEWVAFFEKLLNKTVEIEGDESEGLNTGKPKRRIVVLSGAESMSGTFDIWWPSFVEAVRQYRKGPILPPISSGRKKAAPPTPPATLSRPITIIFNSSPSLLLSHTGPAMSFNKDDLGEEEAGKGLHPMLQALAERFGGSVEAKIDEGESIPLWWGSEELDLIGREQREQRRLSAILEHEKGAMALLPTFGSKAGTGPKPPPQSPMLQALISLQRPASNTDKQPQAPSIVWKALPIIPSERNLPREMLERITHRSLVSSALVARGIAALGGKLVDPVSAMYHLDVTSVGRTRGSKSTVPKRDRTMRVYTDEQEALEGQIAKLLSGRQYRLKKDGWQNLVKPWSKMQTLAGTTIGRILARTSEEEKAVEGSSGEILVRWEDVLAAAKAEKVQEDQLDEQIKRHLPKQPLSSTATTQDKANSEPTPAPSAGDLVVKKVKKAKDLNSHEKRLLGSIVDTTKIASTTFQEVHLPYKTIDAVRTVVSLPLLFPEAFLGGVLKDHSTTGALLFGPPGTGKTLLARAVANDSGARMLAIQPSDVNDKYFGEGEKLVKAVFSLARRLSPCVVFIDEIDSLFGARSSRGSGSGHKAHDQLLTEFMQEMDGLSSAAANKEKRIVVVGATNRPFDLDDAVLRRLPRRLLVDLPGEEDRKAILKILLKGENLDGDVDLQKLAKDTEGFSGSDLKHLCVSAALSAVKDMVKVPWQTSQNLASSSSPPPSTPAESSGSEPREDLVVIPEAVEQVAKPEVIEPVTSGDAGGVTQLIAGKTEGEDTKDATGETTSEEPSSTEDEQQKLVEESDGGESEAEESGATAAGELKDAKPARILSRKHFDVALVEIRPSSTEEGTLPELRKWAEQYGEGGSQRGRKKGFGKGFGFSDPDSKTQRESGFGKVAQDD